MRRLTAVALLLAVLSACSDDVDRSKFANIESTSTPASSAPATDAPTVKPSKIAVLIFENHSFSQVAKSPFFKAMGAKYGLATNMKACTHPSQPNYICVAGGSTRGISTNSQSKKISGASIMGKTIKAGRTATVFAQSMRSDNCRLSQLGYYHPRHGFWPLFVDERALCEQHMIGYDKIKQRIIDGTLSNMNLIVPNNCSNAHDCSLSTADKWARTETERLMAGPDYQAGELVIVLTWDEDDHNEGNRIHTVVIHPSLDHVVVSKSLNLISLHRTLARFGNVEPIGSKWTSVNDLAREFGIEID